MSYQPSFIDYYTSYNEGIEMQPEQKYSDLQSDDMVHEVDFEFRKGFVKKVYCLLIVELALTLGLIALAMNTSMGNWFFVLEGNQIFVQPFYWVCFSFSLTLQIVLYCCIPIARKVPVNYCLLLAYIIFYGCLLAGVCQFVNLCGFIYNFPGQIYIWIAWAITFALVISLTLYSFFFREQLVFYVILAYVATFPLLICLFLSIFMYSKIIYIMIMTFLIIIYGFYLLWETQVIIGGEQFQLSIDDYIVASLILYGTIIQLFIRLLELILISRAK